MRLAEANLMRPGTPRSICMWHVQATLERPSALPGCNEVSSCHRHINIEVDA